MDADRYSRRALGGLALGAGAALTTSGPAGAQARPPWFDVRDYGAAGDGSADDTQAIRATVVAAAQGSTGAIVVAPPGRYRLSGPVHFPAMQAIDLVGAGKWQTIFHCTTPDSGLRFGRLDGSAGSSASATGGFYIEGNSASLVAMGLAESAQRTFYDIQIRSAGVGLSLNRTQNALFENVYIWGCNRGAVLDRGAASNTFTNLCLRNNRTNLLIQNSTDMSPDIPYRGRPSYNKFFGGVIEGTGGDDDQTVVHVDHAAGQSTRFIGTEFSGQGPKIRYRHADPGAANGLKESHDLELISCRLIDGVGIEHTAANSTIHLLNNKFVSTVIGIRAADTCWVDLDSYRGHGGTWFANVPGATHGENHLLRHVMTHPLAWKADGAPDVSLRRSAPGRLHVDGSLVIADHLGIGSSTPTSALGAVVRKIPVFDADGTPLGFLPVHTDNS